jgi:hypothetical protein
MCHKLHHPTRINANYKYHCDDCFRPYEYCYDIQKNYTSLSFLWHDDSHTESINSRENVLRTNIYNIVIHKDVKHQVFSNPNTVFECYIVKAIDNRDVYVSLG